MKQTFLCQLADWQKYKYLQKLFEPVDSSQLCSATKNRVIYTHALIRPGLILLFCELKSLSSGFLNIYSTVTVWVCLGFLDFSCCWQLIIYLQTLRLELSNLEYVVDLQPLNNGCSGPAYLFFSDIPFSVCSGQPKHIQGKSRLCENENESRRKGTAGEEANIHTERCQTAPLCHTNAAVLPKFAQMPMLPKQSPDKAEWNWRGLILQSDLFFADDVRGVYVRAPVCLRSEPGCAVFKPLHILFINVPSINP